MATGRKVPKYSPVRRHQLDKRDTANYLGTSGGSPSYKIVKLQAIKCEIFVRIEFQDQTVEGKKYAYVTYKHAVRSRPDCGDQITTTYT